MVLGALARRIHVEHSDHIGVRQRLAELAGEHRGARVEVRLKHRHQSPRCQRARSTERGRDLGGVMGVIVDHNRPAGGVPDALKAPAGSAKACEARDRALLVHPGQPCRLQRGGRVERVVGAGHRQPDLVSAPLESASRHRSVDGSAGVIEHGGSVTQRAQVRSIPDHRLRRAGQELPERLAQLDQRSERRVMVELDVGEHGDLDVEG